MPTLSAALIVASVWEMRSGVILCNRPTSARFFVPSFSLVVMLPSPGPGLFALFIQRCGMISERRACVSARVMVILLVN